MTRHAGSQLELAPPVHRPAPEPSYEIRTGHCCRACGVRLAWPGPAGIMFADGTAECHFLRREREARDMITLIAYVPVDGFLPWLLAGWRFPRDVAQPMAGYPGLFSCLMERADA